MFQTAGGRKLPLHDREWRTGGVVVPKTTSGYTVGNIIAVFVCMLVAVGVALYAFFGNPSRGHPLFIGAMFTAGAVWLGWTGIKAIRSRRN
jgi:threonine/homoserine/homoserine lactone efflux protein